LRLIARPRVTHQQWLCSTHSMGTRFVGNSVERRATDARVGETPQRGVGR
jgi:hypothetical protein